MTATLTHQVARSTMQTGASEAGHGRIVMDQIKDYARIEQAIAYLDAHYREQPLLTDVARAVGLSEYHFQRLFRRWAGVSPKRFLQFLTVEHAKAAMREGQSVLHAALDAGLSGPGRLHDHFISLEAVTPGEFRRRGRELTIVYGVHPSAFGYCFIASTDRGLCWLEFLKSADDGEPIERLARTWSEASLVRDERATTQLAARIFDQPRDASTPMPLAVQGTNFQIQVWRALLRIPAGTCASYQAIARSLGREGAERAVGRAVGQNPVAFLIPCHRVIRSTGVFGAYRWGPARKKAMLGWEAARHLAAAS